MGLLALSNNRHADAVTSPDQEGPRWLAAALASSGHWVLLQILEETSSVWAIIRPIMNKCLHRWGLAGHSDISVYH